MIDLLSGWQEKKWFFDIFSKETPRLLVDELVVVCQKRGKGNFSREAKTGQDLEELDMHKHFC